MKLAGDSGNANSTNYAAVDRQLSRRINTERPDTPNHDGQNANNRLSRGYFSPIFFTFPTITVTS